MTNEVEFGTKDTTEPEGIFGPRISMPSWMAPA